MGIFYGKCNSQARLDGKTAVITGCNTGIGKITAMDFYRRGARVIMACRCVEKAEEAAEDIRKQCQHEQNTGEILVVKLDLSSLTSVRSCANHLNQSKSRINLLINNAGVMACPKMKTEDGFEMQFGTNHLGHFLFTLLLLPKIIKSAPSRIVNVSSLAHVGGAIDFEDINFEKRFYSAGAAYAQSKLANILFTKELARRLKDIGIEDVTTYSLHPGVIATELMRHLDETYIPGIKYGVKIFKWFIKTPEQGAQTTIYCAVDETVANESGYYYSDCARSKPFKNAENVEDAKELWNISLKLVGLNEDYDPFTLPKNI